jgi:hypothetical protein
MRYIVYDGRIVKDCPAYCMGRGCECGRSGMACDSMQMIQHTILKKIIDDYYPRRFRNLCVGRMGCICVGIVMRPGFNVETNTARSL